MNTVYEINHCAEDDTLRSRFIQELIQADNPHTENAYYKNSNIPKIIVQYWNDLNMMPADVQECLESWEGLESAGFTRLLFDDELAREFISQQLGTRYVKAFDRCHHPAMRCDYFRLCYILLRGGFYVDADDVYQKTECCQFFCDNQLKLQPLCYDISTDSMVKADVFTKKENASPDWIFYVNNNPIIAPANHPVIRLALERATEALLASKSHLKIQSTTGPGNLSASLVRHSMESTIARNTPDFVLLPNWEAISISRWPLSYRNDERNWRLWKPH